MLRLRQLQPLKINFTFPFIRRGQPLLISKAHKPLWFEQGWRPVADGKDYVGYYVTAGRTWRGLIRQPYAGSYQAYIWHPPLDELGRNTSHRPCFSQNGEAGRYSIHFRTSPQSLDHTITTVESVLAQACTDRS